MKTQLIVRIDAQLKDRVSDPAKVEGKSIREVVRELLEDYVKDRNIGLYIDDLWQRVGDKLKAKGVAFRY